MDNVYVYFTELPPHINEMVAPGVDGYTVYISTRLSMDKCISSYMHSLSHIANGDFDRDIDVQEIEYMRHGLIGGTIENSQI